MYAEASLSPIEERILIALFQAKEHRLLSDEITKLAGIAFSTLSAEQRRLVALGLLQKKSLRFMDEDRIRSRMGYELTMKGELIALHLKHVSELLKGQTIECPEVTVVNHLP
jgi:DNA-binding MarR family transcriptional regulator